MPVFNVRFLFSELLTKCLSDLMCEDSCSCSLDKDISERRVLELFTKIFFVINVNNVNNVKC